jgi:hypothetical protein
MMILKRLIWVKVFQNKIRRILKNSFKSNVMVNYHQYKWLRFSRFNWISNLYYNEISLQRKILLTIEVGSINF